jgi:hypothetical protein
MARNQVQFQKGMSEPEFQRQYGTEEQCVRALSAWRWRNVSRTLRQSLFEIYVGNTSFRFGRITGNSAGMTSLAIGE